MRTFISLFIIAIVSAVALLSFVHFQLWVFAFISAVICHITIEKIRAFQDISEMEAQAKMKSQSEQ